MLQIQKYMLYDGLMGAASRLVAAVAHNGRCSRKIFHGSSQYLNGSGSYVPTAVHRSVAVECIHADSLGRNLGRRRTRRCEHKNNISSLQSIYFCEQAGYTR